jgi:hypothetical protein
MPAPWDFRAVVSEGPNNGTNGTSILTQYALELYEWWITRQVVDKRKRVYVKE